MKIRQKLLLTTIGLLAIFLMSNPLKVNAALQANGNTSATKDIATWLLQVRQMEATGGTLGLTDTINTSTLVSTASESNNIDIHMEKNTEYGAMAILSASAYGNQNKIASGETTTGNKSGVYINLNKEWVSAGSLTERSAYINAKARYKNYYTTNYAAKVGDAISETAGWHSSGASTWLSHDTFSGLLRAYGGSIFSYYGYGTNSGDASYSSSWASRACVVVGNGI